MQDSLGNFAASVGGGLVSPGVGVAELVVGLLVALGFAWSAVRSAFASIHNHHHHDRRLPERRA